MRLRREIEVDWARARGGRVPIISEGTGGFEFNEPALAVNRDPPVRGVIGWDPSFGWVLVLDAADAGGSAGSRSGDAPVAGRSAGSSSRDASDSAAPDEAAREADRTEREAEEAAREADRTEREPGA